MMRTIKIPGDIKICLKLRELDGYPIITGVITDWYPSHVVVYASHPSLGRRSESYRPRAPLGTDARGRPCFRSRDDLRFIAEMQRRFAYTLVHPKAGQRD